MLQWRIWNEMRSQHQSVLCRSGQWSQSQIGLVKPIYQKFRAVAWSWKAVRRERWKMHQIYSCSDENLEVFTTVISSKCEYIGTIMLGAVLSFGWKEGFILSETFERSSSSVCSACAALRCQLGARCFFLELIHAGASTLWLCKILAQAKLGEIWSQCSCTYEVIAKVTACNCVAILCDRKENEVLWAVSSSDELGELHECGI